MSWQVGRGEMSIVSVAKKAPKVCWDGWVGCLPQLLLRAPLGIGPTPPLAEMLPLLE